MEKKGLVLLVFAMVLGLVFGLMAPGSAGSNDVPLPSDINIVPPNPSLPKEVAALSGKWEGSWTRGRSMILVVEKIISENEMQFVYAWGDWGANNPGGFERMSRKFSVKNNLPQFGWEYNTITKGAKNHVTFEFEMEKDLKTIKGFYEVIGAWGNRQSRVTLKKVE